MNEKLPTRISIIFIFLILFNIDFINSSAQNPVNIQSETTERISVSSNGIQANNKSYSGPTSSDGRYVVFTSFASNLVSGDDNDYCDTDNDGIMDDNCPDIFLYDRQTRITSLISISSSGEQGNSGSYVPQISADGCCITFMSDATNLVSGDTNGTFDVFVRNRITGITNRISVSSNGNQGNGNSWSSDISANGQFVIFTSEASNLVQGDTNGVHDAFVHNLQTGETIRVSVNSSGQQANNTSGASTISADGRYIAFESEGTNLVDGDNNGFSDVFIHDQQTGDTNIASVSSTGVIGNYLSEYPIISSNGNYVLFESVADNLVDGDTNVAIDIFVHNQLTGETSRVSVSSSGEQANGDSFDSGITADGRYVAFYSYATNLVDGDTNNYCDTDNDGIYDDNCSDGFVHDTHTGRTTRVSISSSGEQGKNNSYTSDISSDGRFIVFGSFASNLVDGDTNGFEDVFVHDRGGGGISLISGHITLPFGSPLDGVVISAGSYIAVTDNQGNYTINNMTAGTYSVVPTYMGYYFKPSLQTVIVPPAASGINFVGKQRVKLKLLIIPLNWQNTQEIFTAEAQSHIDLFLNQLPINNCRLQVVEDILDVNTQNFTNFTCSPPQGTATESIRTFVKDVLKIEPTDFDILIGLTELTPCPPVPGGSNGSINTLWSSLEYESVIAHELGHIFNLTDEYCSNQAGSTDPRCNDGDIQGDGAVSGDINWLDATLPCDCPPDGSNDSNGSPCCNFGGNNCSQVPYPGICCLGNKIGIGNGRSIMSYASAPEPRAFDIHDLSHLSNLTNLNCSIKDSLNDSISQGLSEDEEQLIVDINLFVHPDDTVTGENISIHYGRPTSASILSGKTGDYSFQIVDNKSKVLWKQDFSVYFDYMGPVVLGEDYSGVTYDFMDVSMQVPQSCGMSELQLFHNGSMIFSDSLHSVCPIFLPIIMEHQ